MMFSIVEMVGSVLFIVALGLELLFLLFVMAVWDFVKKVDGGESSEQEFVEDAYHP